MAEATPEQTRKKAAWAYRTYDAWKSWKVSSLTNVTFVPLLRMDADEMDTHLAMFIREVRKQTGERYPGRTLCEIVTSLQKYMELNGQNVKFISDPKFKTLQTALDVEMKCSTSQGLGLNIKL